jgi:hypothetical protein
MMTTTIISSMSVKPLVLRISEPFLLGSQRERH